MAEDYSCPTPEKGAYPTRKMAKVAAKRHGNLNGKKLHVYFCRCLHWHLTKSVKGSPPPPKVAEPIEPEPEVLDVTFSKLTLHGPGFFKRGR